jgi:hypothetical protein
MIVREVLMKKLLILSLVAVVAVAACNENTVVKNDANATNTAPLKANRPEPKLQKNRKFDPDVFPLISDVFTGGANLDEDSKIFVWNGCTISTPTGKDAAEGKEYMKVTVGPGAQWFGWAVQVIPDGQATDMSDFQKGSLIFSMKAANDAGPVKVGVKSGFSTESWIWMTEGRYGFKYDNAWHEVVIPLEEIRPAIHLNAVSILFMFSQQTAPPKAGSVYFLDGIVWKK